MESEVDKGSTFWFTLPQKATVSTEQVEEGEEVKEGRKMVSGRRILVAEDNEDCLAMITDMLSIPGHEVVPARNGQAAVELAQIHKPDLILMDIRMPVMDGLQATKQIREITTLTDLPIIALSAFTNEADQEEQFAAGCTAHLSKPFSSALLFETLDKYMGQPVARPGAVPGEMGGCS